MVKLLMLITSLAGGGAEKVASELSLNLGPDVSRRVVTLTNDIAYPTNEKPISMNLVFHGLNVFSKAYVAAQGIVRYRKILKEFKPDISLSFLVLDSIINVLSNIGNPQTRTIVSVHIALSMKFKQTRCKWIIRNMIKILYNRADSVLAVSEGVRNDLIYEFGISPEKIVVIPNPTDISKIESLAQEDILDEDWFNDSTPVILNVGRLTEQKGQWYLIRAFSQVRKHVKCRLVIRGSGELQPYLQELVDELKLKNDVRFLGWVDNPYKYMSRASIFVFSSLWEALPCSLVEAMACGIPVIATDCKYGPSEILGGGEWGILIPPMDGCVYHACDPLTVEEERLSDEIIRILNDQKMRETYSIKSKERSRAFNTDYSISKYEELFRGLLN